MVVLFIMGEYNSTKIIRNKERGEQESCGSAIINNLVAMRVMNSAQRVHLVFREFPILESPRIFPGNLLLTILHSRHLIPKPVPGLFPRDAINKHSVSSTI